MHLQYKCVASQRCVDKFTFGTPTRLVRTGTSSIYGGSMSGAVAPLSLLSFCVCWLSLDGNGCWQHINMHQGHCEQPPPLMCCHPTLLCCQCVLVHFLCVGGLCVRLLFLFARVDLALETAGARTLHSDTAWPHQHTGRLLLCSPVVLLYCTGPALAASELYVRGGCVCVGTTCIICCHEHACY